MNTGKIFHENGVDFTRFFSTDKVELVNPIEYYKNFELESQAIEFRDYLEAKNPFFTSQLDDSFFLKQAEEVLVGFFEKFEQTKVHGNFIELLKTTRKKDQEALLQGMTLNTDEFMSLIFKSYSDFGFLYSKYIYETLPKGLEGKKLPKLFYVKDNGRVIKVGKTDLIDGELKNIIMHRKVIVSHFFEQGDFWHCFFLTYNSISGKENWRNGQPHYHYISSSFGITKAEFIESMRTGKYKSTSIHIGLLDYGKSGVQAQR